MDLFKRVSDIISANLNEMMEKFEDPEKMLKQAVREMETSIEQARREVVKAMASEKLVAKELATNQQEAQVWHQRAVKAVESGDDDLARRGLARKQEHDKLVSALGDQHTAAQQASQSLRRQLDAMQAKLTEAKRRLGTLVARKKAADVRTRMQQTASGATLDTDAFAKFDRLRQKVDMAEAEADAMKELAGETSDDLPPAEQPAPDAGTSAIEDELEQLKRMHGR